VAPFRLRRVNYDITPEPTPDQRAALIQALERLLADRDFGTPTPYRSPWRLESLRENVEDE
jgi:hypothetical protein